MFHQWLFYITHILCLFLVIISRLIHFTPLFLVNSGSCRTRTYGLSVMSGLLSPTKLKILIVIIYNLNSSTTYKCFTLHAPPLKTDCTNTLTRFFTLVFTFLILTSLLQPIYLTIE